MMSDVEPLRHLLACWQRRERDEQVINERGEIANIDAAARVTVAIRLRRTAQWRESNEPAV